MDDLISRAAAIDAILGSFNAIKAIEELRAVDAVPVVRCSECKYHYFTSNRVPAEQSHACIMPGLDVQPDFYCAYGERRDGET